MAGTVTYTISKTRTVRKVKLAWVSSAGGAADYVSDYLSGQILRVVFKPDSGGTQPSDLYDVTLKDDEGQDVLQGLGANLSNTTVKEIVPVVTNGTAGNMAPVAIDDTLTLAVTNAGNAKGGQIIIWLR